MDYDGYSFETFEVSIEQRLLRRGGKRLKIQELPFRMLVALLEEPGKIVSKGELTQRLWGEGHFVQGNSGLYVVVGRLREVLNDDPVSPRFVETVSGRGYRFVAPVTPIRANPDLAAPPEPLPSAVVEPHQPTHAEPSTETVSSKESHRNKLWLRVGWISVCSLLLATVGLAMYRYTHRPLIGGLDRTVLGSFVNRTGNHDLDGSMATALRLKLQQSPYVNLVSGQDFQTALGQPGGGALRDELIACSKLDAKVILEGRITAVRNGFHLELSVWNCSRGDLLTRETVDAASESSILSALDQLTQRMRLRLGESKSSVQKFNVPLVQATTPSLAALKAFTEGEQLVSQGNKDAAIDRFQLAVDLDSQFAPAYARLGTVYLNKAQVVAAQEAYQKAFKLRDRTSDREKLYIITHYYDYATGELTKAISAYEFWLTIYPRDVVAINNLALEYVRVGKPKEALELLRSALHLKPVDSRTYGALVHVYFELGDFADVRLICNDPEHQRTANLTLSSTCFRAAAVLNDKAGMQQQLTWARGKPEESVLVDDAGWWALAQGRLSEAATLFADAKRVALLGNNTELASDEQIDQAIIEADMGLASKAHTDALEGLAGSKQSAFELGRSALALARVGYSSNAQNLASRAASIAPLDTILNDALLPSVRAALSLEKNDGQTAVKALEGARPYDYCEEMQLSIAYYRGLGYIQQGHADKALTEFQRIVKHSDLATFPVYVSLAKLEMGHALQILGKKDEASQVFAELATTWKDSDPNYPPLIRLRDYEGLPHVKRLAIKGNPA